MKLGLFTDPHYCTKDVTCGTRRPVLSYGKIREAMDAFRDARVDLVVCLGDLMDDCGSPEANTQKLREVSALIRSYGIPFYCLMGNHDCGDFARADFDRDTGGSYPPFVHRDGGKTLLFLDANYLDAGSPYDAENLDWTNAFLPDDQVERLRDELAREETAEAYVFLHQNLDPGVERHHIIRNAETVRAILRDSGKVKTVFQGHYHPGHDAVIDGIRYHTLPAMCEGEENRFEIVEI